eukprot:gene9996-10862_t
MLSYNPFAQQPSPNNNNNALPFPGGHPHHHNQNNNQNNNSNQNGRKETFEPNKTLFLGDLSYFCTEEDLFNLFSPYGPVSSIRVQRGVSGEPLLHGYIVFHSPVSARQALMEVDSISFMGRNLRVQLGTINHHNKEKLGFSDSKNFTQIHVSFICKRGRGFVVNEQVLRDIFTPFGQIADVAIKKHSRNPKQQRQTGYGFIYFVNAEDACRAVIALKNTTLHDITFDCNISHKSEHMIRSMLEPTLPTAPPTQLGNMNSQYSAMPPTNTGFGSAPGAIGIGAGFSSNFGSNSNNSTFSRYGYPPRDESEFNSRVLGGRGHAFRTGQYGSEDMLSISSSVPSLNETSLYPDYREDFQSKTFKLQDTLSTSSSTILQPLDPFYADPYTSSVIGDPYSSGVAFTTNTSSLSRESPFEFGRDLAQFDQTKSLLTVPDITVAIPAPINTITNLSNGLPSAPTPTPSGLLNSQQSLATLASLTMTDGLTTNSAGSPRDKPLHELSDIKSSSPDPIVNDALLYSFQSLSLPTEEKVEELLKET